MRVLQLLCVVVIVAAPACLMSCRRSAAQSITYGTGQEFLLRDGESSLQITTGDVQAYEAACLDSTMSLPVNRIIASGSATMYICFADASLPPATYLDALRRDTARRVLAVRTATVHDSAGRAVVFRSGATFVSQYWVPARMPGMQEVFVLMTADSARADSLYRYDAVMNARFPR